MRHPVLVLVLVLVLVPACGGSILEPPTDGGTADTAADSAADTAADTGADTLTCQYGAPSALAAEKGCVDATVCAVVRIPISCCQEVAYGVNVQYKDAIDNEVAARTQSCPGCGCAAQPQDETGKAGVDFTVTCDQGKCTAHAK